MKRLYEWKGISLGVADIAGMEMVGLRSLYLCLKDGMTMEEAVSRLKKHKGKRGPIKGKRGPSRKAPPRSDGDIHDQILELIRKSGAEGITGKEIAARLHIKHVHSYLRVLDPVYEDGEGSSLTYHEFKGGGE